MIDVLRQSEEKPRTIIALNTNYYIQSVGSISKMISTNHPHVITFITFIYHI